MGAEDFSFALREARHEDSVTRIRRCFIARYPPNLEQANSNCLCVSFPFSCSLLGFFLDSATVWKVGVERPMKTVRAVDAILKVRLGDRRTRVKAGERVAPSTCTCTCTCTCTSTSTNTSSGGGADSDSCKDKGSTPNGCSRRRRLRWAEWPDGALLGGLSPGEHRPIHPPLAGGCTIPSTKVFSAEMEPKNCYFIGRGDRDGGFVELRRVCFAPGDGDVGQESSWKDSVFVLREGLALPKTSLLELVNTVYAVLVLRGTPDALNNSSSSGSGGGGYYYLHNDFALTAEEEDSVVEWGVGRRLYAGVLLAVGGLLLVALAEQVWSPAVVGILLVAMAEYRVKGVLTNIIRVRSVEWKRCQLVPSGTHGTERTVQVALLTALALADFLGSRELLLAGLLGATLQVILTEVFGQALLTWGFREYFTTVRANLCMWVAAILAFASLVWLGYVFAGAFAVLCAAGVFWLAARAKLKSAFRKRAGLVFLVFGLLLVCVMRWAAVLDVTQADLKNCFSPWKWPLTEVPRDLKSTLRLPGLWIVVVLDCVFAVNVVINFFYLRMHSDNIRPEFVDARGARAVRREEEGMFSHYHVSAIPSRHLLHSFEAF